MPVQGESPGFIGFHRVFIGFSSNFMEPLLYRDGHCNNDGKMIDVEFKIRTFWEIIRHISFVGNSLFAGECHATKSDHVNYKNG